MANEPGDADATQPDEAMSQVLEGLNDLLQLDHDSVGAYEVAQDHLENPEYVAQIRSFQEDHQRHIRNLNDLILSLGGVPVNEPHVTSLLKEGIQRLTASGGDRALLTAWRANELSAARMYGQYAKRAEQWPGRVRYVVSENAADEDRHYDWVRGVLGVGSHDLTDRKGGRDKVTEFRKRVLRKARDTDVRDRTAAALTDAAGRIDGFVAGGAPGGLRERAAGSAHAATRGLNAMAKGLRDPTSLDPRSNLEADIRRNPVRSLLAVFAVGFVLGRLVR